MKKRQRFTREFKLEVIEQVKSKSVSEVCREYDLSPDLISRWKKAWEADPSTAFRGAGRKPDFESELEEALRLVGQLYRENQVLKKNIRAQMEKEREARILRSTK